MGHQCHLCCGWNGASTGESLGVLTVHLPMRKKHDRLFLTIVILLVVVGVFIFSSASLGLLARKGVSLEQHAARQLLVGLGLGICALVVTSRVPYTVWRTYAPFIFLISLAVSVLVFVPHIGIASHGARRWIALGPMSFQTAELLKFGFVLYISAWLSSAQNRVRSFREGVVPFAFFVGLVGVLLLKQPDTGTSAVFCISALALFVTGGGKWSHVLGFICTALIGLATLAYFKPYVLNRFLTFFDPNYDTLGVSYQARQALIAIGSGGLFGRGFGQSIQKFNFLPEPTGDSIFAVAAEEFGFVGTSILLVSFLAFALRGLHIAVRAPDSFGRLVTVGFVLMITTQSFVNIASMIGVIPLTGVPLIFVSQGGSAMLFALAEVGIILNISRKAS